MLSHAHVPFKFWTHAFDSATLIINSLPTSFLQNKSP